MEQKIGKQKAHIAILHGNVPDEAQQMEQIIRDRFNVDELMITDMGPVIGVHAGPGTLGLVFYPSDQE